MRVSSVLVPGVLTIALAAAACGDDDNAPLTSSADGGAKEAGSGGPGTVGDDEVKQTGKIVRARATELAVEGATVTVAGKSVTTNASGDYELAVPKGTPTQMTVTAPDFYKLVEQEWIVSKDFPRGETQLLPVGLANLLAGLLAPPRDATKGLLVVTVRPLPPCDSEEGTTLTIDPPGAKLVYIAGGLPSSVLDSVKKNEGFSAIFYDIEPGVTVHVTASSPRCGQAPFPVEIDGVTLTGNQKTEAGDALSYMRVFLSMPKIVDAGGQ